PDDDHAGEVAALALAQAPTARRILVIGGGYSLCERFLGLPQVESVTWLHPDPDYPVRLLTVLPEARRINEARLRVPRLDPRRYLREPGTAYDLIILNLPDATTLSLNRYFTAGFYSLLRERLDPVRGVVAVRFSGGENYLGGELVNLGASLFVTLESVFPNYALQPGGESWLFASVEAPLTDSPDEARARFAAIPGAADVCLPDRLLSAFPPDRVEFQLSAYRQAAAHAPEGWLLNTAAHPKALLYALLLVGLQGGVAREVAAVVRQLSLMGPFLPFLPLILYGLLRFFYLRRGSPLAHTRGYSSPAPGANVAASVSERRSPFDAGFLVFSAGLAGMSFSLVLMFLYQSAFGSIYLQIGLLSSLFMLGLFTGGLAVERLLTRLGREPGWLLVVAIALHVGLMAAAFAAVDRIDRPAFVALFFLAGFLGGVYVPVAVFRLKRAGLDDPAAGGAVEWLDTLGGAAGGLLAGLWLLPLLGLAASLIFPALALVVNLPPQFLGACAAGTGDAVDRLARRAGYVLFGLSVFLLFASRAADRARPSESGELLRTAAEQLAPGLAFKVEHATRSDGPVVTYLVLEDGSCLFTTDQLAPDICGYGGPITLAVLIGREGDLCKARILRANESPQYQRQAEAWLDTLQGCNLFDMASMSGVDGASGATFTSRAIVETLRASGCLFSQEVLRRAPTGEQLPTRAFPFEKEAAVFLLLAVVALVLRRRPSVWIRCVFLLAVVLFLGWRWNMQYSAAHVLGVVAGAWPAAGLTVAFVLIAGVPVLAALFGNFYCGHLCPFGALQELIGELRPRSWAADPDKSAWRFARWVKYGLLFALLIGYALTRDAGLADMDPLNTVFSPLRSPLVVTLGITVLVLSVVYRRFWCRNFCPASAFLALINGLKLTVRWL
ncbi:MAG: 4Fe-4S binding protein, partial [Verrucomicrobia bacterium]|nr:4Fe-4S binding protein [Verrucomicrobiota bacterium]